MSTIPNKYFIKQGTESFQDITTKWVGLTLLKIDSLSKRGKAKNIYVGSWINSNTEDVFVPDTVCFENPDIDFSFIVRDFDDHSINVQNVHDSFIDYMMNHKVTIKSLYENKSADFVCQSDYKPTDMRLKRSLGQNYILGTITMHRVTSTTTALA